MTTATQACFAISASLYRRERTGEGDYLDLSMLDTAAGIMAPNLAIYATNGTAPQPFRQPFTDRQSRLRTSTRPVTGTS